jgi:hypothetical protein
MNKVDYVVSLCNDCIYIEMSSLLDRVDRADRGHHRIDGKPC